MKKQILKGAFILTLAGIITRIIGFYYRIFLSRRIGATGMGLYQMIFPIFGLCHALSIGPIQTIVSRFTALKSESNNKCQVYNVLKIGITLSFVLSLASSLMAYVSADYIAIHILKESRCASLIRCISIAIPFCSIHGCICGHYLGLKNATIPALAQLIEPVSRIIGINLICASLTTDNEYFSPIIACIAMVIGEAASTILCILLILREREKYQKPNSPSSPVAAEMVKMAFPLTLTRLTGSFFAAFEAAMIPISLVKFGLSNDAAISTYGILTGMAMPFILFPSTITNSISSMLLPSIAEYQAKKDYKSISDVSSLILKYCISIGVCCTGYFYVYGPRLGILFFDSEETGLYISLLSWLCPFMYLITTMGSVLNGLGDTKITFKNNIISTIARLIFCIFVIPVAGIKGYLLGILAGEIICTILHLLAVHKKIGLKYDVVGHLVKPTIVTLFCLGISLSFLHIFSSYFGDGIILTFISGVIGLLVFLYYIVKS